jgi:hypothetical protein
METIPSVAWATLKEPGDQRFTVKGNVCVHKKMYIYKQSHWIENSQIRATVLSKNDEALSLNED